MNDREKVIRQWEGIIDQIEQGNLRRPITTTLIYDTFALLKAQNPVKPITQDAWPNPVKVCGSCGMYITYTAGRPRYCPNCGCEVKWE